MQKGPTPVVNYLFRAFTFYRFYNYVIVPKPCNLLFALSFYRIIYFPLNRVRLILAMWTRAICNNCRFIFPQILTVNKKHERMYGLKIKSSVDHNKHDKTNYQWNWHTNSHTPPLGYASLLPCLERWSSSRGCLSKSSWSGNLAWG